ncbi:MAG: nucleoside phosphorylase [Clostridiales Family XIII bacterium]|jgi:uridine phosphorylase|nr:nucleoside phosphorylase [Clostridiales Family XIII bacterium]
MENTTTVPTDGEDRLYHLRLRRGEVPPYMILPGDPGRTEKIAAYWDEAKELAYNREYRTFAGKYKGADIGTTSTGIGAPSSEICIHELCVLGVHTCIRIGTTGSISDGLDLGDIVIDTASVRKDGTSASYIEPEYPAAADPIVTMAMMQACENLGYAYGLGIGYTAASFYIGQGRPLSGGGSYSPSFTKDMLGDMETAGIANIEMEAAGQFVVGRLHGMRMGGMFAVVSNRESDEFGDHGGVEKTVLAASEAIRILTEWDDSDKIELSLDFTKIKGKSRR